MNLENTSCVVLASSDDIIADIKTSLSLLKMNVRGALDATRAKAELLAGDPPVLALVEEDLPGKPGEGLSIADAIKNHPTLSGIPVCLLKTDFEDGDDVPAHFDGVFKIPVEFPTFTRQVKKFFEEFEGGTASSPVNRSPSSLGTEQGDGDVGVQDSIPFDLESSSSESYGKLQKPLEPSREHKTAETIVTENAARLFDRRLVLAYGIQLAVLEALERDEAFQIASVSEIPEILSRVTERVAYEFDLSGLLESREALSR
ncbi:MAG: hypothetical protein KDD70_07055 [Bdellovibrionales bacterium]|nr:hypothetical protein [Bdellovibrionales bacterium]